MIRLSHKNRGIFITNKIRYTFYIKTDIFMTNKKRRHAVFFYFLAWGNKKK